LPQAPKPLTEAASPFTINTAGNTLLQARLQLGGQAGGQINNTTPISARLTPLPTPLPPTPINNPLNAALTGPRFRSSTDRVKHTPVTPEAPVLFDPYKEQRRLSEAGMQSGLLQQAKGVDRPSFLNGLLGNKRLRLKQRRNEFKLESLMGLVDSLLEFIPHSELESGQKESIRLSMTVLRNLYARARVTYRRDDLSINDLERLQCLDPEERRHLNILRQEQIFKLISNQDPNGGEELTLKDLEIAFSRHVLHTHQGWKDDETIIIDE
jgi:hypothetical protein